MTDTPSPTPPPLPVVEPFYDRGRTGKWVAPVLLALAGLALLPVVVLGALLVPNETPSTTSATPIENLVKFAVVVAILLALLGIVLGARGMRRVEPHFSRGCTLSLAVMAAFFLLPGAMFLVDPSQALMQAMPAEMSAYFDTVLAAVGVVLALLALLRWRRVRLAGVLTPALALLWLPLCPFGTAAALVWLLTIRRRETSAI